MAAMCPLCGGVQVESLLCPVCVARLTRQLRDVPSLVDELDITLSRQGKVGNGGKGGKGIAHEKTTIHLGAAAAAWDLQHVLCAWAIEVTGVRPSSVAPTVAAADALLSAMPAIRRHPESARLVTAVCGAIESARRVVDRPVERRFLGPCAASLDAGICTGDLYVTPDAEMVRCKTCLTEHKVAERRTWMLSQAASTLLTVREAAQMVSDVGGIRISQASIRGYLHRGRLAYRSEKLIQLGDLLAIVTDDTGPDSAAA